MLDIPLNLLNQIAGEKGAFFLEVLHCLLKDNKNLKNFINYYGFT